MRRFWSVDDHLDIIGGGVVTTLWITYDVFYGKDMDKKIEN